MTAPGYKGVAYAPSYEHHKAKQKHLVATTTGRFVQLWQEKALKLRTNQLTVLFVNYKD